MGAMEINHVLVGGHKTNIWLHCPLLWTEDSELQRYIGVSEYFVHLLKILRMVAKMFF